MRGGGRSPNFRAAKKQKMPRSCGKPYGNACYAGYDLTMLLVFLSLPGSLGCVGYTEVRLLAIVMHARMAVFIS